MGTISIDGVLIGVAGGHCKDDGEHPVLALFLDFDCAIPLRSLGVSLVPS